MNKSRKSIWNSTCKQYPEVSERRRARPCSTVGGMVGNWNIICKIFLSQLRSWKPPFIPKRQLAMQTFFILLVALFPLFCIITYKIWSFCKQISEFVEKPFNYIHDQFKHLTTKISSHFSAIFVKSRKRYRIHKQRFILSCTILLQRFVSYRI